MLDFETLRRESAAPQYCNTFAYWAGVLADPKLKFARDADEACSAMSHQYNVEEQAFELDDLRGYPEIVPEIFRPVAPVILALRWSPFITAETLLGSPEHTHKGTFGKTVAFYRPVPTLKPPAVDSPDQKLFIRLLHEANERAWAAKAWVLLCGEPGWSYDSEDLIAGSRRIQKLMKKFGFVHYARKP